MRFASRALSIVVAGALAVAACGTDTGPGTPTAAPTAEPTLSGTLTIYSGRSESLVGPLIDRFRSESGLDVRVNYGGTTDLAATILEEGDASPADVFFATDAGALGAVAREGRFTILPTETLGLVVDPRFVADDGTWVGVSGRARVVVYDTRTLSASDLPTSIDAFTDPAWKGRIGWAPTNGSFQAFVTAYRVLQGDDAAKAWLEGILANKPKVYEGNDAVLAAVAAGEIEVGFNNHYYLMRQLAEQGDGFPVRNHFLAGDDPGSLINIAGAGILTTAPSAAAGQAFVDFLLTPESQAYFSEQTHEYPLIDGVAANPALPTLADIDSPDIDLSDLDDLAGTLRLMQEAGVL